MAVDIVAKDKQEIQWKGLPDTSQDDLKVQSGSCKSYHFILIVDSSNNFWSCRQIWNLSFPLFRVTFIA